MSAAQELDALYLAWIEMELLSPSDRDNYHGLLSHLHDIPFYWTLWSDENRAGDAHDIRSNEFLSFVHYRIKDRIGEIWLGQWATATPSVLEVLLAISRRWSFYFEKPASFFFAVMLNNLNYQQFIGKVLTEPLKDIVRRDMDNWMNHRFPPNGAGTPFPINAVLANQSALDIWGQMNSYSLEHFQ